MEELEKAGENLHNISELTGGGYLATIGVYHELHCVVSPGIKIPYLCSRLIIHRNN
jgi:hydrogenase maturation factor HypE